jgi:hypothetical protein
MKPVISPREWETLSAYLDGQLSKPRKAAFDRELATRPELELALRELQKLKLILHSVPLIKVRRNFMVKPGAAKPTHLPILVPVFRMVSAIAGVAVVVLLAIDLLPALSLGAMAPKAAAPFSLEMANAAEDYAAAPQIIIWEGQAYYPTETAIGLGGGGPGVGGGSAEGSTTNYAGIPTPMTPPAAMMVVPESTQSAELFTKADQFTQPTTEPTPEPTAFSPTEAPAVIRRTAGSSPILGVAPTEQQGTFTYTEPVVAEQPTAKNPSFPLIHKVEIGLGALALALGIASAILRKKA